MQKFWNLMAILVMAVPGVAQTPDPLEKEKKTLEQATATVRRLELEVANAKKALDDIEKEVNAAKATAKASQDEVDRLEAAELRLEAAANRAQEAREQAETAENKARTKATSGELKDLDAWRAADAALKQAQKAETEATKQYAEIFRKLPAAKEKAEKDQWYAFDLEFEDLLDAGLELNAIEAGLTNARADAQTAQRVLAAAEEKMANKENLQKAGQALEEIKKLRQELAEMKPGTAANLRPIIDRLAALEKAVLENSSAIQRAEAAANAAKGAAERAETEAREAKLAILRVEQSLGSRFEALITTVKENSGGLSARQVEEFLAEFRKLKEAKHIAGANPGKLGEIDGKLSEVLRKIASTGRYRMRAAGIVIWPCGRATTEYELVPISS